MSGADLDDVIRDLTGIAVNSEFGGLPVPDVFPFARVLPNQCRTCRLRDDHKIYSAIGIDANPTKAQQQALIDIHNDAAQWVMEMQSLVQQMHLGTVGMKAYSAVTIGGQNMVKELTYDVSSVGASSVVLSWGEGDTNPRAVPYVYPNPDYIDAETTPEEPVTLTAYHPIYARGIVRFNAPSALRCWDGWVFKKVAVTSSTITLYFEDDDLSMSLATTNLPEGSEDTITATILQYPPPTNPEPWAFQRLLYPLWAEETTKTLTPTATLMTLTSGRIVYGSFSATDQDGNALSLSSLIITSQTSGGSWTTYLNLVGYDLEGPGITSIICTYLLESTDTTGVIAAGQSKCKHCIEDPTESWGMSGDFFCAKRAELKALGGSGTTILNNFYSDCYMHGTCQFFEADSPTNPWAAIEQLLVSHPYMARTPFGGATTVSRIGVPGLMSLAEALMAPQSGRHETRDYSYARGGWKKALMELASGTYTRAAGLAALRYSSAGGVPYFLNTATWPEFGPGGDNLAGRKGEYGASDTSLYVEEAQVTSRDCDVHPYDFGVSGASGLVGKRQRFRAGEQIWIPQIGLDSPATRNGHTITRGYWDSHFEECDEGDETYRVKIQLATPFWAKYAEAITTVTVRSAVYSGSPTGSIVQLYLEHKTVSVSIDIEDPSDPPNRMEVSKSWKQGSTNVIAHEYFRPWNYDCALSIHGPGQGYVRAGHVLVADGHKLWITGATPCASASYKGSWDTGETSQGSDEDERAYYAGNVDVSGMSGLLLPLAHGPNTDGDGGSEMTFWANRLDRITIADPNLVLNNMGALGTLSFSVRNDGWMLEGATIKTAVRGSDTAPAAVSGAAVLGADGMAFLPDDITNPNTCGVIDDATVADRIMMPSVRETTAGKTTAGRMMRE